MRWVCPKCERRFKTINQSHSCTSIDVGELFIGKPDNLVLAYDALERAIDHWEPNFKGAAKHSIVFTNLKAWLIIRPMNAGLDVKFYNHEPVESDRFTKITGVHGKYAHHIRVKKPEDIDNQFLELIRIGYNFAISGGVIS